MYFCDPLNLKNRIISGEARATIAIDADSEKPVLAIPTIIGPVCTELFYIISDEEYECAKQNPKAGFAPFLNYIESRYKPIEDDRFLGVSNLGRDPEDLFGTRFANNAFAMSAA
jgi:hypothetical protein